MQENKTRLKYDTVLFTKFYNDNYFSLELSLFSMEKNFWNTLNGF